MIEHSPDRVETALLYFHSAGVSSEELRPFLPDLIAGLPHTYLWAGDGVIGGVPLMRQGLHYGEDARRYWFSFPMQDASSPESFARHAEAMGAVLACGGAYVNALADQVRARFQLPARKVILCGFQHGSSIALSAAMLRRKDPYALAILFEPYLLEAYYLKEERDLRKTTVVCIDNEHIRQRTRAWIDVETDREFRSFGLVTQPITVPGGGDPLDAAMMQAAIRVVQAMG